MASEQCGQTAFSVIVGYFSSNHMQLMAVSQWLTTNVHPDPHMG